MPDNMMDREYIEKLAAYQNLPVEEWTDDELEVLWANLLETLGHCNVLCNTLMNRRKLGLTHGAMYSLQAIKFNLSHLRYYLDHRHDPSA